MSGSRRGGAINRNPARPRVAVFAPDALLSVTIERRGEDDDVHMHAAGQGVWVARMAAELGAWPILCSLAGGETGIIVSALLEALPGERRLVRTGGSTGSYVVDRRGGSRELLAAGLRPPPQRHELDDLVTATCTAALASEVLVVCNPYPAVGIPDEVYGAVLGNMRGAGVPLLVDLSSPRLDRALAHAPDLVKCNDWELAEYAQGPVDGPRALEAVARLQAAGARTVVITRGEQPILVVPERGEPFEIVPPPLAEGHREGCGDTMMGAIAAGWARRMPLRDLLVLGAAAGSVNFLRRGLGTGGRAVVEEMIGSVEVRPLVTQAAVQTAR